MNAKRWIPRFLLTAAVILFSACSSLPVTVQRNAPAGQAPNVQSSPFLDFWADQTTIPKDGCTTLHWRSNWGGVWIDEKKYPETSSMQVCPTNSRQYSAEIGDQLITKNIYIQVQASSASQQPAANSSPMLDFWSDKTIIYKGECTTLRWRTNWGGVWISEVKYPANGEMKVCPTEDIQYNAEIGDQVLTRAVIIQVRSNAGQQPAPQQPNPPQPPPAEPKITKVNVILGSDKVVANVTTDGPTKVGFLWKFSNFNTPGKSSDACFGVLTFSSAGTQSAVCGIGKGGCDNCVMDFYATAPYKGQKGGQWYGRINLPKPLTIDLAVTDLFADNMPRGRIYARLTNRGPHTIINSKVTLDCKAELKSKSSGSSGWDAFTIKQTYPMVTLAHNETKAFYTGIDNQSDLYSYLMTCTATPSNGSYLSTLDNTQVLAMENNPANNTYKEDIPFFFQ